MATTTIHSLKYQIVADTGKFTKSIVATRNELSLQKKLLRDMKTPTDNYGEAVDRLSNLQRKGLLSMQQYSRAVAKLRHELNETRKTAGMFAGVGGRLAGVAGGLLPAVTVGGLVHQATAGIQELDSIGDLAAQTGIAASSLARLGQALKILGDTSLEETANALRKMNVEIGKAVSTPERAAKSFEVLGVSAQKLAKMKPEQQFITLVEAMHKLPTEAERTAAAMELFGRGSSTILTVLHSGAKELTDQLQEIDSLGLAPTDAEIARAQEGANAMKEMAFAWQSIRNDLAVASVDIVKFVAEVTKAQAQQQPTTETGQVKGSWLSFRLENLGTAYRGLAEQARLTRESERFTANANILSSYRFNRERLGFGRNVTEAERMRIFGNDALNTADPRRAQEAVELMLAELRGIRQNTEGNTQPRFER